jgi:hypothetical protein
MPDRESVIRYVATYVNKDGERTLMSAAQGRFTFATEAEAQEYLDAVMSNNPAKTIADPKPEVRPCPCYPNHFDPQTIWFD